MLESVSQPYYAAVLRGVGPPEIDSRERTRRATFARTAKATLVAWVREGGDIRALDVATVTKTALRAEVSNSRAEKGFNAEQRIERAQAAILDVAARATPQEARNYILTVMSALQNALDDLAESTIHHESTVLPGRMPPRHIEPRVLNRGAP